MNTKPCMSSYNKRKIIFITTKDCSDSEGYKNQTNFVAQKIAASDVLSAQCINRTLTLNNGMVIDRGPFRTRKLDVGILAYGNNERN